jgi:hypothetical protein
MIEAKATWTLEGPDDSIDFSPTSEFVLTEKPRTAVDDRRDTYDYPLDDGAYVGDAYAGARMWSLRGILRESTHSARNVSMQRLTALLNSLRREDGLLKWEAEGFPAVQSTVRRMGSVDFSGGAGLHVPFTFGLIAGDPRVYSQTENTEVVSPTSATVGANLLTANQAGIETSTEGWQLRDGSASLTRSNTFAQAGSWSLRMTVVGEQNQVAASTTPGTGGVAVTPGWQYTGRAYVRSTINARRVDLTLIWYNAAGAVLSTDYATSVASSSSWELKIVTATAPANAAYVALDVALISTPLLDNESLYIDTVTVARVTYSGSVDAINAGDAVTPPRYVIDGPADDPLVENTTTLDALQLDTTVDALSSVTVDTGAREIYSGAALSSVSNLYDAKPASDPFPLLLPGTNAINLSASGTTGATQMVVYWRDAWMP